MFYWKKYSDVVSIRDIDYKVVLFYREWESYGECRKDEYMIGILKFVFREIDVCFSYEFFCYILGFFENIRNIYI